MATMRAKLRVTSVTPVAGEGTAETLVFNAVGKSGGYPQDGSDENNTYAKYTPSAELKMSIMNPNLFGKFKEGQEFYVDFTEAT